MLNILYEISADLCVSVDFIYVKTRRVHDSSPFISRTEFNLLTTDLEFAAVDMEDKVYTLFWWQACFCVEGLEECETENISSEIIMELFKQI